MAAISAVLPDMPLWTSSSPPLPRKSCLMINRAELDNILVAKVASLNTGCCLPPKKELASARGGILGFSVHRLSTHSLQHQTVAPLSPMPAQRGRALGWASCGTSPMGRHWTRRLCRSQHMIGSSGCCTLDACSSAVGMRGHCCMYRSTFSNA